MARPFKARERNDEAWLRHCRIADRMHEAFSQYVEAVHEAFERLIAMEPLKISTLPRDPPAHCVYLFSEGDQHLYVGRTNNFRSRMRQHSTPGATHNQAVFAFRLARESTGRTKASYSPAGSRAALSAEPEFARVFGEAKTRVRQMDVRYVEERSALGQALLEIYVAVVLKTPYNDFDNH